MGLVTTATPDGVAATTPKAASPRAKVQGTPGKRPAPPARKAPRRAALPQEDAAGSAASRYAALSDADALAALRARAIAFERVTAPHGGVRLPLRLVGKLHGVHVHSALPPEQAKEAPWDIIDGRLLLALDDYCALLQRHHIVEVVHFTIHRPAATPTDAPQLRHAGALAIDVGALRKDDGTWLRPKEDWPSSIGSLTCGKGAKRVVGAKGRELQSLVCEAHDLGLFHFELTPHYDWPHRDHLHLEVTPGARWLSVD